MKRITAAGIVLSVISMCLSAPAAPSDTELSPWQALPEETIVAVRMPDGSALLEALRERTKFGAVLLDQARFDGALKLIQEADPDGWAEMVEGLAEHGLGTEDFSALLKGESVMAVLLEARQEGREPLVVLLGWVTPGAELVGRIVEAVSGVIEDQADQEYSIERTDLDLAGHEVIHLVIPQITTPRNFGQMRWEMGPDGQAILVAPDEDIEKDSEPRMTGQNHVMIVPLGDRLVVAVMPPQLRSEIESMLDNDEEVDFEELSGIESAMGMLARFLEAHDSGDGDAFVDRVMATPGLAAALPEGDVAIEAIGDLGVFYKLMAASEDEKAGKVLEMFKALGIDGIGAVAMRIALDGNLARTGVFLEAASPRRGLVELVEQPALLPEPPAWVPNDIDSYVRLSADLGAMYQLVKDLMFNIQPDDAPQNFGMIEQSVMMFLQTDPATLLGSLGTRHVILQFASGKQKIDFGDDEVEIPVNRLALVWELTDADLWQRIFAVIATSPMLQGAFKLDEEQGFTSLRPAQQNELIPTVGLFLGKGLLVLTVGPDVAETLLASINNPPEGEAAFRNGKVMQRMQELQPFEPCVMFQAGDMGESFERSIPAMMDMFLLSVSGGSPDSKEAQLLEGLKELIPTAQQFKGMFGIAGGTLVVNEHGLVMRSISELPPSDGGEE